MAERREYEALRAAMETIISENKGVVGRVKRALDQVAAMDATESQSEHRDSDKSKQAHDTEAALHKG
ncbi:hypothetical protein [Bradyrhizobium elkanii]